MLTLYAGDLTNSGRILFFANLKKYRFHQNEVCFLEYIVLSKRINMEAEIIETMKDWDKPKSVRNIQVFIGFANFYQQFIQSFSKIIALLISILKITGSPDNPALSRNNGSKSASTRNNNSRQVSKRNNSNDEIDEFDGDNVAYTRKSEKSKKSVNSGNL